MPARRAVLVAAASAAAGALLLGGNATYAAWSDSANSETTTITAGTLAAEIKQTGPSSVNIGTNPSIVPTTGSQGIIPGVQAQQWAFTITNKSESATPADVSFNISGSVTNTADYGAIRPYLRATANVSGNEHDVSNEAFGPEAFSHSVDVASKLAPGDSVDVELKLWMPATVKNDQGNTVDVALEVLNHRSANNSVLPVFTMKNSVHLKQVSKP